MVDVAHTATVVSPIDGGVSQLNLSKWRPKLAVGGIGIDPGITYKVTSARLPNG